MLSPRILFFVNDIRFFISHRLALAEMARERGYQVFVVANCQGVDTSSFDFDVIDIDVSRSGQNPFREMGTFLQVIWLFFKIRPTLVHLVTIKPVLYGGLAARITGVPCVVSAVSGLGSVFSSNGVVGRLRKAAITRLYKMAFRHSNISVIFQNENDQNVLTSAIAPRRLTSFLIPGSGVDLREFCFTPESNNEIRVSMACRLLKEKGVIEFVEAARLINKTHPEVRFDLIGALDPGNPSSISQREIDSWREEGIVNILGYQSDISRLYAMSNIVCLPSYYGEGLPKSLIEAAASGRAIVTTDMPGCRDAVIPEITGLLIKPMCVDDLVIAILRLVENEELRLALGRQARQFAEERFSLSNVVSKHFEIYEGLLNNV